MGPSKKNVLPYLFSALRDPDPMVRRSAAFGFGSVIEPGDSYVKPAMPQLISMLKDPTYQVRAGAGCALASIGRSASTKGVLSYITPLLRDRHPGTRGTIASCMSRMGEYARSAAPQVFPLLQDPNLHTRWAAEGFLGNLGYKVDSKK
jgi:HEAT repeat protein